MIVPARIGPHTGLVHLRGGCTRWKIPPKAKKGPAITSNPGRSAKNSEGILCFFRETLCEGKKRWPWLRKPSPNGQALTRDRERRGENDKDDFTFGFRWLYLRGLE